MSKTNSRKLSRMGRRRFISTLAGLGISSASIHYLSQEALADITDDPGEEVPRLGKLVHTNHEAVEKGLEPPKIEAKYYTISRDKFIRVESAHAAARSLESQMSEQMDTTNLAFGVTTINTGQRTRKAVIAEYQRRIRGDEEVARPAFSFASLKNNIPDTVAGTVGVGQESVTRSGIPTVVVEREIEEEAYYDHRYDPVPGGCQLKNDITGDFGTSCTPALDGDKLSYVMVTAGHLGWSGDTLNQPGAWRLGEIEKRQVGGGFDAATVELATRDHTYRLASDSTNSYGKQINGTLGWDTIKDYEGNSYYTLHKQGRTTGESSGNIQNVYTNPKRFTTDADHAKGDSGGPHFRIDTHNNYALIAGIHNWNSDGDAGAMYIGEAEDQFNLTV